MWSPISASSPAEATHNPIRAVVDSILSSKDVSSDPHYISLSIGDPTVFGNLNTHASIVDAVVKAVSSYAANGYVASVGTEDARAAIAKRYETPTSCLSANDVVIASGCSGALELCIRALASPGECILIPAPGFSLYRTICEANGLHWKYYNLLSDRNWEIDLEDLKRKATTQDDCGVVKAIVLNNPSNPCGAVYSADHLRDLLALAESLRIPIISDEVYADMNFPAFPFVPVASLTQSVPVLTCGGIAKQFMVPGWRLGWILIHDRGNAFVAVRKGIIHLSQVLMGANTLMQAALPEILLNTPPSFLQNALTILYNNAQCIYSKINAIPGLSVNMPQGAMYMMVKIDVASFNSAIIKNDVDFCKILLSEESLFCLPGSIFKANNFFRLVICAPIEKIDEACKRLATFCARHSKN